MSLLLPRDAPSQRRRDQILAVLALVAAILLVLRAARKEDGVLRRNVEFGARFLAHEDPYLDARHARRVHGPYPPSYALVTAPLSLLPVPVARVTWALAQVGALAAGFVLLRRWTRRAWPELAPHTSIVFALAVLLASRFLLRDMAGGGGNLLYATAAAWGLELALFAGTSARAGSEHRRTLAAGFLLALPLVLKPNLAPLVLVLACMARWRALGSTLLCAALLYWAPALVRGFGSYADLTARWLRDVAAFGRAERLADPGQVPDGFPLADTSMNQGLRESLWRVLDPPVAAWTARGLSAALLLVACIAAVRARGPRSQLLAALAFLPVCVLVSPIAWKAHHAALLPLFGVLCASALSGRRRWLAVLLVVYYGTCVLLSEELVGSRAKEFLQEISVVACGALALFAATVALSCRRERTAT